MAARTDRVHASYLVASRSGAYIQPPATPLPLLVRSGTAKTSSRDQATSNRQLGTVSFPDGEVRARRVSGRS